MMHKKRRHYIKRYATAAEVAHAVRSRSWTLCSGFRFGDLALLNDATSEDAIQEYAVINMVTRKQIESLTVAWYESDEALARSLMWLAEGKTASGGEGSFNYGDYTAGYHEEGFCHLCA